jgi:cold shock CspA family protein
MKYSGTIRTFIPRRKFGFILRDDNGKEVFFHQMDFEKGTPVLGQRVGFELGPAVRLGMPEQGINVTPVSDAIFAALAGSTAPATEVSAVKDGQ